MRALVTCIPKFLAEDAMQPADPPPQFIEFWNEPSRSTGTWGMLDGMMKESHTDLGSLNVPLGIVSTLDLRFGLRGGLPGRVS